MCSLFATVWSEEELDLGFDQKLLSLISCFSEVCQHVAIACIGRL